MKVVTFSNSGNFAARYHCYKIIIWCCLWFLSFGEKRRCKLEVSSCLGESLSKYENTIQDYFHIFGRATSSGVFNFMNMNKYERLNRQKKHSSSDLLSGGKRVAAYCRVSTEREEQAQSFESQCDFFDVISRRRRSGSFIRFLRMKEFRGRVRRSGNSLIRWLRRRNRESLIYLLQKKFPVLQEIRLTVFIIQGSFGR